jgi:hypothetical protein
MWQRKIQAPSFGKLMPLLSYVALPEKYSPEVISKTLKYIGDLGRGKGGIGPGNILSSHLGQRWEREY